MAKHVFISFFWGLFISLFSTLALAHSCPGEVLNISAPSHSTSGTAADWAVPAGGPYKVSITDKGSKGGGSYNLGADQNNMAGSNNAGGQVIIECLGTAAFTANFSATQPVCANPTQGSLSIDLTGDNEGNTTGLEYAIVAGNTFSGSPAFSDITADPFNITSGFGTTGDADGETYTVRIRLKYNPDLFLDHTYTLTALTLQRTWTGALSTDWHTDGNWNPACVPTAANHAIIPSTANDPVILAGTAAVARSVHVLPDGSLTAAAESSLTINGFFDYGGDYTSGLRNEGTVSNSGHLVLGSTGSVGKYGLWNQAAFTNNSGAEIAIDRSSFQGLFNQAGTFINSAKITIGANNNVGTYGFFNDADFTNNSGAEIAIDRSSRYGLYNDAGTFINSAKITIGANNNVGTYGLWNEAAFTNNSGAEIAIDRSSFQGLFNQAGTFINSAKITIGANNNVGNYGFLNLADFTNNSGAEIAIDRSSGYGLYNEAGTFINSAKITIGASNNVGGYGLWNEAAFTNNSGAEIAIDRSSFQGLFNQAGTFINSAKITIGAIGSVGSMGIRNLAIFQNNTCSALINIVTDAIIDNNGTFTNAGTIIENASGNSSVNVNSGIVQNLNGGTFSIGNNTGTLISADGAIWTGCTSTDWNDADNWHNNTVPTADDDVKILDVTNDPVIGETAMAKTVHVLSGGSLTINTGASLTVNGSFWDEDYTQALKNNGTVSNSGILSIGSAVSPGEIGLRNEGTFNNNAGGETSIDRSTEAGLWNASGTFTNAAKIIIGANNGVGDLGLWNKSTFHNNSGAEIAIDRSSGDGLYNQAGTFINSAKINIGAVASVGVAGLSNRGTFQNNTDGEITIDNSNNYGLDNDNGTFTNTAKITIGAVAGVGFYGLYNLRIFHNNAGGEITIDRSLTAGLYNKSAYFPVTFTNAAKITIGANNNVGGYGLWNEAAFTNNSGAEIAIDRSSDYGLYNDAGTFINSAKINIGRVADVGSEGLHNVATFQNNAGGVISIDRSSQQGLHNSTGTFANAAKITIGGVAEVGSEGLHNTATFQNNTGGVISIDRSSGYGLTNFSGSFINVAKITIGALANVGAYGIDNNATFQNNADGEVAIDRSYASGLKNDNDFINAGKITLGALANIGIVGIENTATFDNIAGGEISIDRSQIGGLFNGSGTFTNAAKITIGANNSVGYYGLWNQSAFHNNVCAELASLAPIKNDGGTTITNAGLFTVNTADTHANDGSFTNNGILSYPQGNPIPNVTNNEIIVAPTNSDDCQDVTPAFALGNPVDFTIEGVYTDVAATIPAGTYTPGNNTFTPTSALSDDNQYDYYVKIEDGAGGCTRTVPWQVTVQDDTPPTATCQDITVSLDGTGDASILPADVFDGGSDNCGTANPQNVSPDDFSCENLGANTVTLTVSDGNGNTAICTATVTVQDNTPPMANCRDITISLDGNSGASILPADVFDGGTDNCGTANPQNVSPDDFSCENLGVNTVTLTVSEGNGNTATCTATVTVQDDTPPTANCRDITISLDGDASILPADVFDGGSDNCGTANPQNVSPDDFSCENLGVNTVTLTVSDGNGNTATCTATVTVQDDTPPTANCRDIPISLDGDGDASILPADVFDGGSDNCGTANPQNVSPDDFSCENLGVNTVTLTVSDGNGNTATCTATVTVQDDTPPTANCRDITISLDGNSGASILPADVFDGGSDNCGTANPQNVSPDDFSCENLGVNTVTLTVSDGNGNTNTCTATVTVQDDTPPTANCRDITVSLDGNSGASILPADVFDGGSDNCGTANPQNVSPDDFSCENLGVNTVTLTVSDGNGNTATCTATVTVQDDTPPTANCRDITVSLDGNSGASILPADVFDGGSDNCGTANPQNVSPDDFSCENLGANTVTLTVSDGNGNTATCTATVTVQDDTPPTANCRDITVSLDGAGGASILPADVFDGGSDNCGTANPQNVSPDDFSCENLGANTVTLAVSDGNGNTATCTATVTVQDNTLPSITCPNPVTVTCSNNIPAVNLATVTAGDNCGAPVKSHLGDATSNLTCTNRKTVTRTYKAADASGNTKTCTQIITVYDDVKPNFNSVPANVTVQCNSVPPVGNATATDGCGGTVTVAYDGQTITNILCTDRYTITRQWTATDACGNTKTATQRITVQDTQKPVFSSIPANVTVQCNGIPGVGTPAATDNCDSNVTIDYNGETFTNGSCADSYIVTRKWTATDNCGNTKTATQRITVQDTQKPVFTTVPQNLTIQCSDPVPAPGSASATDNCDISVTILFVGQNDTYTNCPNNYAITRTWKATDNCGNWATATQTITVQDTQAPAFTFVPQHITIECSDQVPPIGQPTATDNCGGYVHIGFLGNASAAGDCPQEYTITRTWRATDECGHSTTATQTITVQDTQAPAFTNAPANLTLACGAALPVVPAISAQDNCDNQVSITYLGEENDGPDCPYTVTRTWETADDCGNVHTHTQTITVGNTLEVQGSKFEVHHSRLELRPGGPGSNFKLRSSNVELQTPDFELFPNPASEEVWLDFSSESDQADATVYLFAAGGQLIKRQAITATAGQHRYRLDLTGLPGGLYHVMVSLGGYTAGKNLVVVRQ